MERRVRCLASDVLSGTPLQPAPFHYSTWNLHRGSLTAENRVIVPGQPGAALPLRAGQGPVNPALGSERGGRANRLRAARGLERPAQPHAGAQAAAPQVCPSRAAVRRPLRGGEEAVRGKGGGGARGVRGSQAAAAPLLPPSPMWGAPRRGQGAGPWRRTWGSCWWENVSAGRAGPAPGQGGGRWGEGELLSPCRRLSDRPGAAEPGGGGGVPHPCPDSFAEGRWARPRSSGRGGEPRPCVGGRGRGRCSVTAPCLLTAAGRTRRWAREAVGALGRELSASPVPSVDTELAACKSVCGVGVLLGSPWRWNRGEILALYLVTSRLNFFFFFFLSFVETKLKSFVFTECGA